jgi:hypothetical protein
MTTNLRIAESTRHCIYGSNMNSYILQACRSPHKDVTVRKTPDVDSKMKETLMEKHSEVELLKKENVNEVAELNSQFEVRNIFIYLIVY